MKINPGLARWIRDAQCRDYRCRWGLKSGDVVP